MSKGPNLGGSSCITLVYSCIFLYIKGQVLSIGKHKKALLIAISFLVDGCFLVLFSHLTSHISTCYPCIATENPLQPLVLVAERNVEYVRCVYEEISEISCL
jgi:hypothetical protein